MGAPSLGLRGVTDLGTRRALRSEASSGSSAGAAAFAPSPAFTTTGPPG